MMTEADHLEAAIRRGYEYYRTGRSKEAAKYLVATIKTHPASPAPYKLLADVQRSLGNPTAEAAVLEELTSLEPLNAETWGRLASIQSGRGRSDDAYRAYLCASRLMPNDCRHWEGLGAAALAAQRFPRAEEARDELLKRFPGRAASHLLAGHIQKALGNREPARAAYDAALALNPHSSEAIYNRVDLDPPALSDALTLQLKKLLENQHLEGTDSANLNFALARILEAAKEYAGAFTYYEKANAAVVLLMGAKGIRYRPADAETWVARTLTTYPSSAFRQPLDPLPINLRPIFIVGMPRSGTSMVEQIFASHPKVAPGGELTIATDCELLHAQRRAELGLHGAVNPLDERERSLLTEVRERYIDQLLERDLDAEYVTDKLPGNFTRLAFIRLLFPEALIVHCGRHPIATCWSLFASNFALHDPYYNSLEHLAHYYRCYERLMSHWGSVLQPPMMELRYEDLVSDPETQIRRLIAEAGLDWNDRCMAFHANQRPVLTASHAQTRTPIYATSVDRWRHYEPQLRTLKELCP
jgi:tetratricopeptide (TPR) repeat protein